MGLLAIALEPVQKHGVKARLPKVGTGFGDKDMRKTKDLKRMEGI
jgi:hypothetical protein